MFETRVRRRCEKHRVAGDILVEFELYVPAFRAAG
jgi:hypothetical protein